MSLTVLRYGFIRVDPKNDMVYKLPFEKYWMRMLYIFRIF